MACGEWGKHGTTTHGGLRAYMDEAGYPTICLGFPGLGNFTIFDALEHFIRFNLDKMTFRKIIFFQADWVRDVGSYAWFGTESFKASTDVFDKGYFHIKSWYVSSLYSRLHGVYAAYGIPSVLVGGGADTLYLDRFEQEYPGVRIGCQSLMNLAVNDDARIDRPVLSTFKYGGNASRFLTLQEHEMLLNRMKAHSGDRDLEEMILDMQAAESRDQIRLQRPELFPDDQHLGRVAHKKLFNHLCANNAL